MKKEEVKEEFYIFLKTLRKIFLPKHYDELSKRNFVSASHFFTSTILVFFLIAFLLSMPMLFSLPSSISQQLTNFEMFKLNTNITMNNPIVIPENNPILAIDTKGIINNTKILINQDGVRYNGMFYDTTISLSEYEDLVSGKEGVSNFLFMLFLIMLPGLLLITYFYFIIKFVILVFIASLIIFIILKLAKYRLRYKFLLTAGIYASPILMLELFMLPMYYIHYFVYFIFFLVIAFRIAHKRY